MNNDLISREALNEYKFVGIKNVQIGGKTLESINKVFQAYQQGWNDAIDSIIDNAPTVEQEVYMTGEDCDLFMRGYKQARKDFERPQGDWLDHGNQIECDQCHVWFLKDHLIRKSFCPNCGAEKDCTKMHIESC